MGRFLCAAALLLLCAGAACGSLQQEPEHDKGLPRWLLESPDCKKVHRACATCRNRRIPGTRKTETVCATCDAGWRLRKGSTKICDCTAGFAFDDKDKCKSCPKGKFCPGGDAKSNPDNAAFDCPAGLTTVSPGSKSVAQCFTQPGFGRQEVKDGKGNVSYKGVRCDLGTYNVGGNTAGCIKCSPGTTTVATGSSSASACVAPAGSYLEKGVGKRCPRGTYSSAPNTNSFCPACGQGVTTATDGSTSPGACALAVPGYKMTGPGTAAQCELNTYKSVESPDTSCTPCPFAQLTRDEGSTGDADCLAPPGYELVQSFAFVTECEVGWFKPDWNRNPCTPCGENLITESFGSTSQDDCRVPAGYGVVTLSPKPKAVPCVQGSYGDDVDRAVASSARCFTCGPNLFTLDQLDGIPAPLPYTSEQDCLVKPGFGFTETAVTECQVGFYNPGRNRQPCQSCSTGFTTLGTGSTAETQCVVQPGWVKVAAAEDVKPCDRGFVCPGGSANRRFGSIFACDPGYTTQEAESNSLADCSVCAAGFGGPGCGPCPYNTYSQGTTADGDACTDCPKGTISARGSGDSNFCFTALYDLTRDYFIPSNDSSWTAVAAASAEACMLACVGNPSCFQARYELSSGKCDLQLEDASGSHEFGLRIAATSLDFAFYKLPAGLKLGTQIGATQTVGSKAACMDACKGIGDCEAVDYSAATGSCALMTSDYVQGFIARAHLDGSKLYSDSLIAEQQRRRRRAQRH